MKASKEIRRWVNRLRKKYGKPNGVVHTSVFDNPNMERKIENNKRVKNANHWKRSPEA